MHTMFSNHVHPLTFLSRISTFWLQIFLYFFKPLSLLSAAYICTHSCGVLHWGFLHMPVGTPHRKTTFPFTASSTASSSSITDRDMGIPHPCQDMEVITVPLLSYVHWSCHIQNTAFTPSLLFSSSYILSFSSS